MQVQIKNCRMSFSDIRKAYQPKTGDPKFTFSGICSDDTQIIVTNAKGEKKTLPHTAMEQIIEQICKDAFGGKMPPKLQRFAYCRADQEVGSRGARIDKDGDFYEGYEADTMYFSAGTKVEDAPDGILIIDQKRNPLPASKGHPVNGDYVNAIIDVFAFEFEGKKGVSASLEGIQFVRKGEPFGNSKLEATAFDEEELEDDDDDNGEVGDLF